VDAYQRIRSGERMRPVIFRPASTDAPPGEPADERDGR